MDEISLDEVSPDETTKPESDGNGSKEEPTVDVKPDEEPAPMLDEVVLDELSMEEDLDLAEEPDLEES